MNESQIKIKAGYSRTVFEEPFKSQVFTLEIEEVRNVEAIGDMENFIDSLQGLVFDAVNVAIDKYAPKWKTFEDLQRMQKGLPPLGRKKADEGDFLEVE